MKYSIVLFIILFPAFAAAQAKKEYIDSLAKNVMNELMDSWTLGIDSNNEAVDIRVYNKFKNLFDPSARIVDDIDVTYQYAPAINSGTYTIDTTPKNFEIYAHDIALQVKSITMDFANNNIVANTSDTAAMTFIIKRKLDIQKTRQFVIPDTAAFVTSMFKSRKDIEFEKPEDTAEMRKGFLKKLDGTKDAVYLFSSTRRFRVVIKYTGKNDSCRITAIEPIEASGSDTAMHCTNDDDRDGVLNAEDNLPKRYGDFTANGMPDHDFDGMPDEIADDNKDQTNSAGTDQCKETYGIPANEGCPASYFSAKKQTTGFLGLQLNSARINLPGLNQLGYRDASGKDAIDVRESQKGALQNQAAVPGIYAGADFTYFFGGKRKRTGLSLGFIYSGFTAQYKLTGPIVYTFKSSDGVNEYRRQITIKSLAEEMRYNVFNLPVLFNYRTHVGRKNKTVVTLKAGPSLMLFSVVSNYNATIGFGGLYQVNSSTKEIEYTDYFDRSSSWNVYVTADSINAQNPYPGADTVFNHLFINSRSYDFASNKNYRDRASLTRATVAVNFAFDIQREISPGLGIKAGGHLLYAPLFERGKKYVPINQTSDQFNSIYNSSARSSYSAFGFYVGFVLSGKLLF